MFYGIKKYIKILTTTNNNNIYNMNSIDNKCFPNYLEIEINNELLDSVPNIYTLINFPTKLKI